MDGLPKLCDYSSANEFLIAFELHMDCFLISKSIDKSAHNGVKLKFLKLAMSKAPGYNALGIDGRFTYEALKKKVSLLLQPSSTPFKDFIALDCKCFATATDYIVKGKALLKEFIDDEPMQELLIKQRIVELLPSDAGLLLRTNVASFDEFVKHISFLWTLLRSEQTCLTATCRPTFSLSGREYSNNRNNRGRCYICGKFNHYAKQCRSGMRYKHSASDSHSDKVSETNAKNGN